MARTHQARKPEDYRIILQQDTPEPVNHHFGRVSKATLLAGSIEQFQDHPVDVYASDVNHAGGAHFDSKVRERHATQFKKLRSGTALHMRRAIQQLIDEGTDPIHIYCEGAHERGIDYMLRLRMNDLHDVHGYRLNMFKPQHRPSGSVLDPHRYTAKWKLDHPEFLLGDPDSDLPSNTYEYWERLAPNYALSQVREYTCGFAQELVSNYDLDLLELDYIRFPFHFPQDERYAQRHVMTAVVRRIRQYCDAAGKSRGRPVRLSVRVPDTIDLALRCGYDVAHWLRSGLLDMITISGGCSPFNTPWRDIVSVAHEAGVPAFACLNHGMFNKNREMIRAAAQQAYDQGVTGIKLWDFYFCMDYYHRPGQNPLDFSFIDEIADPGKLAGLSKIYVPGNSLGSDGPFGHVSFPGQLPLTIGCASDGIANTVVFDVADDMSTRNPEAPARLTLEIINLGPFDEILFRWNGQPIEKDPAAWVGNVTRDQHWFELPLTCSQVLKGPNTLDLILAKRDEALDPFVSLMSAGLSMPQAHGSD